LTDIYDYFTNSLGDQIKILKIGNRLRDKTFTYSQLLVPILKSIELR